MPTIDWFNKVIKLDRDELTLVSGTLYELNTDTFRRELRELEASPEGMPYDATHRHNTEVTVAGTTFARTVEIINGYSVEFEDGQYSVRLSGSNNNIFDVENGVLVQNQVQVISTNAAGLVAGGSSSGGLSAGDILEANLTYQQALRLILAATTGKLIGAGTELVSIRNVVDSKDRIVATVDEQGNRLEVVLDVSD